MASNEEDPRDPGEPPTEGFDPSSFIIELDEVGGAACRRRPSEEFMLSSQVAGDEFDGGVSRQNPSEQFTLLYKPKSSSDGTSASNSNPTHTTRNNTCQQKGFFPWIKKELNKKACWKCKVWMFIPLICAIIVAVIIISMAVNSALHEDEDEKFDCSQFSVPQYFNGSFQLSSKPVSNETQMLGNLQDKLVDLYRSSPALGRYFSQAETYTFRNETAVVLYRLMFVLPAELQEELRNFTLSREMVRNVLRQFLYDQDPDDSGSMFIDPVSLKLSEAHS